MNDEECLVGLLVGFDRSQSFAAGKGEVRPELLAQLFDRSVRILRRPLNVLHIPRVRDDLLRQRSCPGQHGRPLVGEISRGVHGAAVDDVVVALDFR